MNYKLAETLANVNKPTETWTSPDGSAALVLPYGGRILGLFAPGSERNFFWTHPALDSAETARAFYRSARNGTTPAATEPGCHRKWTSSSLTFLNSTGTGNRGSLILAITR